MSAHHVRVEWSQAAHPVQSGTYTRDFKVVVSPNVEFRGSAAPEYLGSPQLADPEQILVSALASCHMLYFLAVCEGGGYKVAAYVDEATGEVTKSPEGFQWVSKITLRPRVTFGSEKQPSPEALHRLHERAHKGCFIANSIKSEFALILE